MKKSVKLLAAALLFLGFATCAWANTIWTVNASFIYPSAGTTNTATGTFTLDSSLNVVTWNITVAGTNVQADNTFTPANSSLITATFDTTHVDFYDASTNQYVDLYLASPLSNTGGTITLLAGDDGASKNSTVVCPGCGVLVHGTIKSSVLTTNYFANNTSAGAPQGTLRITNHDGDPGDLCAMIYVYDAAQELAACCGCRVTPNGLQTINVRTQLLVDTLTRVTPNTGVIQIISGSPTGSNPIKNHNNDAACDPTTVTLSDELEAGVTHVQNKVGTAFPITETQFDEEELSSDEFGNLQGDCAGAIKLGSGFGRCDCGVFENVGDGVTPAPVAP
jgi:hypothetical protein